ncbi:MAG: TorF family putative porin, partial [Steroidobacteraceae bacterium]
MKLSHAFGMWALAAALTVAAVKAQAEVSATITVASDYDFRGITQTARDPALQGSVDFAHESGFHAGIWAGNVDFGDDANVEVDYYAGFGGGDTLTWDVGGVYYSYPDADDLPNYDFGEFYGQLGYRWLTGKLSWSPSYSSTGESAFYYEANAAYSLPAGFGLTAHFGRSDGDYWDRYFGDGYTDWSIGLTYT